MTRGKMVPFVERTVAVFDAQKGRGVPPWGDNLLLLTARGAKSGELITNATVYRRHGDDFVIAASKGGSPVQPRWYGNLVANPEAEIEFAEGDGVTTRRVRARAVPEGPERDELYAYLAQVWPDFLDYERRTDRKIPVVVLTPTD
jgi:deazaflavin-dependent oxidoreductase (nitroreductase family)